MDQSRITVPQYQNPHPDGSDSVKHGQGWEADEYAQQY